MPPGIIGDIARYEAGDTRQFTWAATITAPSTVAFNFFDTVGASLAPAAVQAGSFFVASSGNGAFYVNGVVPVSVGLYFYQWTAWDAASRPYITRGEFEIIRTEPVSFFTYAEVLDVTRTGRQIFGRGDITQRDLRPYLESGDAYIDAKLGVVMSVPLNPTPNLIRDMSKVFCLANFYSDRYSVEHEDAPPAIIARKKSYEALLDKIVAGDAVLVSSGVAIRAEDEYVALTGGLEHSAGVSVFGMRDFETQTIDADIVTAEDAKD